MPAVRRPSTADTTAVPTRHSRSGWLSTRTGVWLTDRRPHGVRTDLDSQQAPGGPKQDVLSVLAAQPRCCAHDRRRILRPDIEGVVASHDDMVAPEFANQPGQRRRVIDHAVDVDTVKERARRSADGKARVPEDPEAVLGPTAEPGEAAAAMGKVGLQARQALVDPTEDERLDCH